jgi:uncharacterized FAD-dependent dehydrogenase
MSHLIHLELEPGACQPDELPVEDLAAFASEKLDGLEIATARLLRFSFDARRRFRRWRLEVEAFEPGEVVPPLYEVPTPIAPPAASAPHVVVVGSGPAGLVAALELLGAGLRVTLLERGFDVQRRRRDLARIHRGAPVDPDSNYCHGEGGAGTYSDGKLYTRSGDARDVRGVLELLVAHGAPESILADWRPHIGSNRLPKVVAALTETIRRRGGEVRFGARAVELETRPGPAGEPEVTGVVLELRSAEPDAPRTTHSETLACDGVVLATGHSALDALTMARRAGARLEAKGFAMGLRAEHPQPWLDQLQYGGLRGPCALPAAFYELVTERKSRGVYSFCMCPGGFIVPASTGPSRLVVNGMSLSRRDSPFANSGVVVAIEPEDLCGGKGLRWGAAQLLRSALAAGGDLFGGAQDLVEGAERMADGWLPPEPADEPLVGVLVQRALELEASLWGGGEGNRAPAQRADHFAAGRGEVSDPLPTSYQAGLTGVDLARCLPRGLSERLRKGLQDFEQRLPGFAGPEGQVVGVESRTSSPVRLPRHSETREAVGLAGLFPAGEGAGYAGGIVSAAIDGSRVARGVVVRFGLQQSEGLWRSATAPPR